MAVLVPVVFGRRFASDAEKKLAERFRSEVGDDTVVMHSVGLARHATKRWAEADFVVVSPHGIFCVEVKGGRVSRVAGEWRFEDRHGHVDAKSEGPFEQAGGAAGALQSWLANAGFVRDGGPRFQVGHAVMTPDCVLAVDGPDIEPNVLYDKSDSAEPLDDFLERIGSYWQARLKYQPLSADEIDRLRQAIRPDFEGLMTKNLTVGLIEDELLRMTEGQKAVLNGLVDNDRLIVRGAAGTGKSVLATIEGDRLAALGKRVLVVCRSKVLAGVLRNAVNANVDVYTTGSLLHGIVERAGLLDRVPDATPDAVFGMFLPELAQEALSSNPGLAGYDALVIDEGQDVLAGATVSALNLMFAGGFAVGCWRAFLDPNQDIFGRIDRSAMELLESGMPAQYRLTENCRNTRQVVMGTQLLAGAAAVAESRVDGPEVVFCERWTEPWEPRVRDHVNDLLADGLRPQDLAVLVPFRDQVDALTTGDLLAAGRGRDTVYVSTIAGFKGLDATAIVLAGIPRLDTPVHRQDAYIGATRAKVLLRVVLPSTAQESFDDRVHEFARAAARQFGSEVG